MLITFYSKWTEHLSRGCNRDIQVNQKSIHLLNHFHYGLSAPDIESNSEHLLKEDRKEEKKIEREKRLLVREVEDKKESAMGGRGKCQGGITDFFFILSLISFFFSFSEIQSPSPAPCRAAAQPRAALHGHNPDQLQGPLELHAEREEKRAKKKMCVWMWKRERERERHLMTGKVFGGIRHSKTQQREVER